SECWESIPVGVERLVLFGQALAASAGDSPPKKLSGTPTGIDSPQLGDVRSAVLTLRFCLRVQPEELAQRADVEVGLIAAGAPLHPQRGLVQRPRGDRLRHRAEALAVSLAEALPTPFVLG